MAKTEFDFSEMMKWVAKAEDRAKQIEWARLDFMDKCTRVYINRVKKKTNVGEYRGGNLRRGWKATKAVAIGSKVEAEVYNNVEYAAWVNYGHTQWQTGDWVEGFFFKERTDAEIAAYMATQAERFYFNYLKELGSK